MRDDLARIAEGLTRYSGWSVAERKLDETAAVIRSLALTPHKGTIRNGIAPGLRAIPAAGRAVVVFVVNDAARCVPVKAIGYAGSDWIGQVARRG